MKPLSISIVTAILLASITFFSVSKPAEQKEQDLAIHSEISSDTDPLADALNIKNASAREAQLILLFTGWIESDPLNAIELIQELRSDEHQIESYDVALSLWAQHDIQSLNHWLSSQTPNQYMDLALNNLASAYSLRPHSSTVLNSVAISLADYPQAILFAEKIFLQNNREESVFRTVYKWIEDAPNDAVQWSIEQNERTEEWLTMLFVILAPEFPVAAVNSLHILEGTEEPLIDLAIELIADLLDYENYDADLKIAIQSLMPYSFRERLIAAVIPGLFEADILSLEEIDQLISSLLPGALRDELQQGVSYSWATRDPEEAAAYAEALTGESREKALEAVVVNWAVSDIEATSVWLESVGGNIDRPARSLSKVGAEEFHLEIADTWANNISDGLAKSEAFRDVYIEWNKTHPLNAAHYIMSHKQLHHDQKIRFLADGVPNSEFSSVQEIVDFFALPED